MAFSTGTFSGADGFDVVQTKLHDFAVAQGWTSHYNTYPYLHLSINSTFVNLFFNTALTMDDFLNSGSAAAVDDTINGHLSTSFTSNGTPATQYSNQVGSIIGLRSGDGQIACNDMTPPYSKFWFFSGAVADPAYIIMVIQKADGRFCMLQFGEVDKKGASYTGGSVLHNIFWHWGFSTGSNLGRDSSGQGSDFEGPLHAWLGDQNAQYNLWLGDLDTVNPMIAHNANRVGVPYDGLTPLMVRTTLFGGTRTATLESQCGPGVSKWLKPIFYLGPNPVNGVTPFFEVPLFKQVIADTRLYYVGDLPGIRWCSMINRFEVEDVSIGSDDWLVFPFKRGLPYVPEPFAARLNTSGPYAYACKINS